MNQLPNLNEMTTTQAIHWYTKEVSEVFSTKNRIAGTYTNEYKDALLGFKQEMNIKAINDRNR